MTDTILLGNAETVSPSSDSDWVVGHFMPQGLRHSNNLEIKLWRYDKQPNYPPKLFAGTEFIIVEKGILEIHLEVPRENGGFCSRTIRLEGGNRDYVIIPPGCKKQVCVTEAPASGVTVRWPSAPGANVVVTPQRL